MSYIEFKFNIFCNLGVTLRPGNDSSLNCTLKVVRFCFWNVWHVELNSCGAQEIAPLSLYRIRFHWTSGRKRWQKKMYIGQLQSHHSTRWRLPWPVLRFICLYLSCAIMFNFTSYLKRTWRPVSFLFCMCLCWVRFRWLILSPISRMWIENRN